MKDCRPVEEHLGHMLQKDEEEFAYVIEGTPKVWVDGYVHDLTPGDFIAFPAGTGIAHTFINDTDTNVLLLVGGQASTPGNRIFYPLHPARNDEKKSKGEYWEDHPQHILGPHDGLPALQKNPK